jgi:hypothetical protein
MTDAERQQLLDLERNLVQTYQNLQVQKLELAKQLEAVTAEGFRAEGALRVVNTIKSAIPPVEKTG